MAGILIAEDDWLIAEDLKITFLDLGCEVLGVASSGDKAIELARNTIPDLLVFDVRLEGTIGGIEAAQIIRKQHNLSIPVLFVTGNPIRDLSQIKPPVFHLSKPWNSAQMEQVIQQLGLKPSKSS